MQQNATGNFDILGVNRYAQPAGTTDTIQFHITDANGAQATTFEVVTVGGRKAAPRTRAHAAAARPQAHARPHPAAPATQATRKV